MGGPPSTLYIDDIIGLGSSSLSNNNKLSNDRRRVSPRKGATRTNLSIFLKADGEGALFVFSEEKAEGRLMGASARRRTVVRAYYDEDRITVA
jgi:hypothetical protein